MNVKSNLAPTPHETKIRRGPVAVHYDVTEPRPANRVHRPNCRLHGIGLAWNDAPGRHVTSNIPAVLESLAGSPRVYHDSIAARAIEMQEGLPLAEKWDDVRVMGALLEAPPPFELARLSAALLDGPTGSSDRRDHGYHRQPHAANCASSAAAIMTLHSNGRLPDRIQRGGLADVYNLELGVVDPTIAMIQNGIGVNKERLEHCLDTYGRNLGICRRRFESSLGRQFNPNASAQVSRLIYQELGMPIIATTRNGNPAQDQETLQKLVRFDKSGLVKLIVPYQQFVALERFAAKLLQSIDPGTGRIHADLDPLAAATGRYGCSDPPLQSVPAPLRGVFVPANGFVLIEADYSQVELRVLAHFSKDPGLRRAFCGRGPDIDLHRRTAAIALGIPEARITGEQRNSIGKTINFALTFGLNASGLAESQGISVAEAQAFIERFFDRYQGVRGWIDATEVAAQMDGFVRTLSGRRRTLPDVESCADEDFEYALRQAVNHVIQGTAADLNKLALARLHSALPEDCRMLMTNHDSVLLEAPRDDCKRLARLVREVMEERPPGFTIPLKVEIRAGYSWAGCKDKKATPAKS